MHFTNMTFNLEKDNNKVIFSLKILYLQILWKSFINSLKERIQSNDNPTNTLPKLRE